MERAFASALLRSSRTSCSSPASASPSSCRGGTLISRLNCPTSVAQSGSAISASTSAFRMDGTPRSSTRLSSISWPTRVRSVSNRRSRSIRANTSSERRTLSRYLRRSSPLILIAWMSRPMTASTSTSVLVAHPQIKEPPQVRDELVVLVFRVRRFDRLDQQLVEVGAGHPVQDDLVQARHPARAEVVVARRVEVLVGQRPVPRQLFLVGQVGVIGDGEEPVGLQVQPGLPPGHQSE